MGYTKCVGKKCLNSIGWDEPYTTGGYNSFFILVEMKEISVATEKKERHWETAEKRHSNYYYDSFTGTLDIGIEKLSDIELLFL